MKNKILVLFLLCLTIIPIFNNLYAYSFTHIGTLSDVFGDGEVYNIDDEILENKVDKTLTLEEWHLNNKALQLANENGYISLRYPYSYTDTKLYSYYLIVPQDKDCKFYKDGQDLWHTGNVYCFRANVYDWTVQSFVYLRSSNSKFDKTCILTDYINTIPIYTDNTFSEIFAGCSVNQDDTIGDPTSDLQLSYEYNEDNTSCHINATLKGGEFTDQIYYSNYEPGITGELLSKKAFPKDGIDVTENQSLFFQAEDKDGNILAKNSISIFGIGKLDPTNFIVDIDTSDNKIKFNAKILNNGWVYNKILCKIYDNDAEKEEDSLNNLRIHTIQEGAAVPYTEDLTDSFKNSKFCEIGQNHEYTLINNSLSTKNITLYFEVRNRETDEVMLTQKYDCNIDSITSPSLKNENSVNSGVINEGQDDEQILDETNDKNIANNSNGNSSLSLDWSISSARDTIKEFFTTAKEFFNLILDFVNQLPKWITVPLYTLFMLAIVVFVFHVIRG